MVGMAPDQSEEVLMVNRPHGHTCTPGVCLVITAAAPGHSDTVAGPCPAPLGSLREVSAGTTVSARCPLSLGDGAATTPAHRLLPRVSVLWLQRSLVSQISQACGSPVTAAISSEG